MKKIYRWLLDYFKTEFHPVSFAAFTILMIGTIWFNYGWDFEGKVMDPMTGKFSKFLTYIFYYGLPWLVVAAVHSIATKKTDFWKKKGFWITAIFAFVLIAFVSWFPYYKLIVYEFFDKHMYYWAIKTFWNAKSSILYFGLLFLFLVFYDREQRKESFYGLTIKGFNAWPYVIMLMIVLPGIIWASYQEDFLAMYPTYKPGAAEYYLKTKGYGKDTWMWTALIYELVYLLDFTSVELYFRGFLIFAFVKYMGKQAILPMVAMYCFLHFGKPMGEAISSIFGGFVLGVISYNSKSIFGGVLIHMGVAALMDITAWIRHFAIDTYWTIPLK